MLQVFPGHQAGEESPVHPDQGDLGVPLAHADHPEELLEEDFLDLEEKQVCNTKIASSRFIGIRSYNQSFFDRQLVCFDR